MSECGLDIAADGVGLVVGIDLLRLVQIFAICTELDVMACLCQIGKRVRAS